MPRPEKGKELAFVRNDIRWKMESYPIFIRTIQIGDAAAISGMSTTTGNPIGFEQAQSVIHYKRQAHTPMIVLEDIVLKGGPENYHMVICFETNTGAAIIGTCSLTEMKTETDFFPPNRVGVAKFDMLPEYAADPPIRDMAMRCLFACGFADANNKGFQLDVIRLQIDETGTAESTFLNSAVSYFGLDQTAGAVGGMTANRRIYSWDLWKTNWVPTNSRFDWQVIQGTRVRPVIFMN